MRFQLQVILSLLYSEDENTTNFRNVENYSPKKRKESQSRRHNCDKPRFRTLKYNLRLIFKDIPVIQIVTFVLTPALLKTGLITVLLSV